MKLEATEECTPCTTDSDAGGGEECKGGVTGNIGPSCQNVDVAEGTARRNKLWASATHLPSNDIGLAVEGESQQYGLSVSGENEYNGSKRKSRTRLTREQKMEVLKLKRAKVHVPEIARRFSCTERTVYHIAREKEALEEEAKSAGYRKALKSIRPAGYPKVEDGVAELIKEARAHRLPVTRSTVASFACTVKNLLLSSDRITSEERAKLEGFRVSEKWTKNVMKRRGSVTGVLYDEVSNSDSSSVAKTITEIRDACAKYPPDNIFNVGETGLFFKLMPRRSYLTTTSPEGRQTARNTKDMKLKDRVSIFVCSNATGSAKVPISIVGKSRNPRCLQQKALPVKYFSQRNAWSDSATFKSWWHDVFLPFTQGWTGAPVLLLLDQCRSNELLQDPRGRVKVMFLPSKCASTSPPVQAGIIASLKIHYRRRLLNLKAATYTVTEKLREMVGLELNKASGPSSLRGGYAPNILDAVEMLTKSWNDVTHETIARCWAEGGIVPGIPQMDALESSSGKGTKHAFKDPEVLALVRSLEALILTVQGATSTGCASEQELKEALAGLQITPGQARNKPAVDVALAWATIEEHDSVVKALQADLQDVIMEKTRGTHGEDANESDVDGQGGAEGEGDDSSKGHESTTVAPSSDVSVHFDALLRIAREDGNSEAVSLLQKAKESMSKAAPTWSSANRG